MDERKHSIASTAVFNGDHGLKSKTAEVEHVETHLDIALETAEERNARIAARATLQNALHGIPKAQLFAEVDEFCTSYGLEDHQEIFRKGALLAQRPTEWGSITELDGEDRAAAAYERAHKWRLPIGLWWVVGVCAIGAAVQGWDQTGSNGANLGFPEEFGINRSLDEPEGAHDQWILGLVNAIPYLSASIIGTWSADPINFYLGRRGAIFVSGIVLIATPIAMAFTTTWQEMLIVRIFFGYGIGLKGATVAVYSAEVSPTIIRGALVMGWQLWTTVGIVLGFGANAVVRNMGDITWRLQIGSSFIPAVPLAALCYFGPESPRWYMRKGRMADAFKSMCRLRNHPVLATRDLYYAWVQWEAEKKINGDKSMWKRFTELFTIPRNRRATMAASTLHIGQNLCGINTIAFYSSTIFVQGGSTIEQALFASLGFGKFANIFPSPKLTSQDFLTLFSLAVFTIDTFGRRALNLTMFPNMAWALFAAGMAYFIQDTTIRTGIVAMFIYIYTIFYSIGEGPIVFTYSAEVFPLAHRDLGQAFPVSLNYFTNFILSLCFPFQLRSLGGAGTFGFYTGTNIIAFIFTFLFMRETKQLTLEELDQVFSVPTGTFIEYQTKTWIPWFVKRYILWQKHAVLEPLYHQDKAIRSAAAVEGQTDRM